jgi:(2Fe-2S) ferredoxin
MISSKHHVLICGGGKLTGDKKGLCHTRESEKLVKKLMGELQERDLDSDIIVSLVSCFGVCDKGPIMVIYPEGEWFTEVTKEKLINIIDEKLDSGDE